MHGFMSVCSETKINPGKNNTAFSMYDVYTEKSSNSFVTTKKNFETIPCRTSGNNEDEVTDETLSLLAKV